MDVDEFEQKFSKSNHVDDELSEILVQRPRAFSISMMPSQKRAMQAENESHQAQGPWGS